MAKPKDIQESAAVWVPIADLSPWANNPRQNASAIAEVAKSIRRFGWGAPIVANKRSGEIIAGHTRHAAAVKLGLAQVPVRWLDLDPVDAHALALADNKLGEIATWDDAALADVLREIQAADESLLADTGFSEDELAALLGEVAPEVVPEGDDDAPAVDESAPPVSQLGEIFELGPHRLVCGDSTDAETVKRLMGGDKCAFVLSDPPYGMNLDTDFSGMLGSLGSQSGTRGRKYDRVQGDGDDFTPSLIDTFFANFGYCKEMFLFGADYFAELLPARNTGSWLVWDKRKESQGDAFGAEFELIWSRQKHKRRMLRHDWFGFLSSQNTKDARNREHPTQKPVSLLADILEQWAGKSCIVADLYVGSGSTLIACAQTGRIARLIEIDPRYCDVIRRRWTRWAKANGREAGSGALDG